jgi:hypothetical protein
MEIHPPEAPIHTVKDFLLHLSMIAIGVLLALGAEGLAEHVHNRHLVREAKENIVGEIRDNHQTLQDSLPKLAHNEQQLKTLLEALGRLRSDRHRVVPDVTLDLNMVILGDSSWKTAATTGALGLMPYREVKDFATDYSVQENVNRMSAQLTDYWLSMTALDGDVSQLSNQQLDDLIHRVQLSLTHLQAVENISRSLDAEYAKRLNQR